MGQQNDQQRHLDLALWRWLHGPPGGQGAGAGGSGLPAGRGYRQGSKRWLCSSEGPPSACTVARYLHEELGLAFVPGTLVLAAQGGCEPVPAWLVGARGVRAGGGCGHDPDGGPCEGQDTMACLRPPGCTVGCTKKCGVQVDSAAVDIVAGGAGRAVA